jgi:hypothetical protein
MGFSEMRVNKDDTYSAGGGYEQKAFSDHEKRARLRLIGSRDGRDGLVDVCRAPGVPERFELNRIKANRD